MIYQKRKNKLLNTVEYSIARIVINKYFKSFSYVRKLYTKTSFSFTTDDVTILPMYNYIEGQLTFLFLYYYRINCTCNYTPTKNSAM